MKEGLDFLSEFSTERNGLYIVYELYTFDNLFRPLLKADFEHEEALHFTVANCSFSAVVFQERIHNKGYEELSAEAALPAHEAARRARYIYDLINCIEQRDS
jgi:hypothetical protein